ncbi:MAG: VCBS repeat-containing protein, partial [Saprospiraceae bacterium]|nr:VCBS repeat-containing protein [Saprospiraceae bacterium]
MKQVAGFFCLIVAIVGCSSCQTEPAPSEEVQGASGITLQLLSSEQTGVDFNNALMDTGRLHVFIWNFLYSGAGVAAGDVNNDGLPDLYFAGNQVSDMLYLNRGDFKF